MKTILLAATATLAQDRAWLGAADKRIAAGAPAVRAVTEAVQQLDPQASVQIDRAANQVQVHSNQPRAALAAAIAEEGYQVAP